VTDGQPLRGHLRRVEDRRRQPERLEQPAGDHLSVRRPGGGRDDAAEDRVAEVGVLERGARRPGEAQPAGEQRVEAGVRQALLPVAPGVVGGEPRNHRQQRADRQRGGVRGREPDAGQRGHVPDGLVVQTQRALVAQQQDRGRREALGHRGDAEHGVGVRDRPGPLHASHAPAVGVHQLAVADDPERQTRLPALGGEGVDQVVHMPKEIGHPGHGWNPRTRRAGPRRRARS
jgi:hypothetical protein